MRVKTIINLVVCGMIGMLLFDGCIYVVRCPKEITLGEEAICEIYYVSTPKQRKELNKLNNQEDVDRFMEAFWKELDPTPGTPENELRNEYYKRYYYANANLSEGGTAGWHTDRGRVFIIYGPPDEIAPEYLIQRGGNTHLTWSLEVWTYDRPAGRSKIASSLQDINLQCQSFIFADMNGLGEYTQIYSTEEGELDDPRYLGNLESEGFRMKVVEDYTDQFFSR
jgi:GWxTD domain-containing protein